MLGWKTSPKKFKRIEIISRIFSDHKVMKLEINYMKKLDIHKYMEVRLQNQQIKEEIKITLRQMKMEI